VAHSADTAGAGFGVSCGYESEKVSITYAACIAAPIFGDEDVVIGALSLSGPTPRIQDKNAVCRPQQSLW
jgi:DNA-binding IclR family transcriptional regulator